MTEPLHLNLLSLLVAMVGSYRARIAHDLVVRPHNAFCILRAADQARSLGLRTVSLLEFGVASGAGLVNMSKIAARVTKSTGIEFRLYGFDTGRGMPPPVDYRDHPDLYAPGDFPMDVEALRRALPPNAELVLGDVATTVRSFLASLSSDAPIGYIVFDLDYFSSTSAALEILADADPTKYLPITFAYFDDVLLDRHNSWCGELLAIREFNSKQYLRKIELHAPLARSRIYPRAVWLDQVYYAHVLDHPHRMKSSVSGQRVLENPYLHA